MVKAKAPKWTDYTPIGNELSPEIGFVQAAIALDLAAKLAVESKNGRRLNEVAANWIELSKALMDFGDASDGPEEKKFVGFVINTKENDDDDRRNEDTDPSPSARRRYIHKESR